MVILVINLVLLPLSFLPQRYLSFTSFLAVIVNIYVFVVIVFSAQDTEEWVEVCYVGIGSGTISMFSAMMTAIVIQMCVLPMYGELEHRSPQKFNNIVKAGFGSLFVIFASYAVLGYLIFGRGTPPNVLDALPHDILGQSARNGAAVSVAAVYPIMARTI